MCISLFKTTTAISKCLCRLHNSCLVLHLSCVNVHKYSGYTLILPTIELAIRFYYLTNI